MLTLITPTSGRPEAFALLCRWLAAQTYKGPVRWIIVSDDLAGYALPVFRDGWVVEIHERRPDPSANSLCGNLLLAMSRVDDDATVLVIEDDDLYLPAYLERYAEALAGHEMVGAPNARYYNVRTRRFRRIDNTDRASLAQTGVRGKALELLRKLLQGFGPDDFPDVDRRLWAMHGPDKKLDEGLSGLHVSVKGMPGKAGYGVGHRRVFGEPDPSLEAFRAWGLPLDYALMMDPPIRLAKEPKPVFAEGQVAIGMVMRNQGKMTRAAIESAYNTASHLSPQFMVWDNGSTEPDALELLEEIEDEWSFTVFRATEGAGWIRAINHMARFSTAPFFIGLNNDIVAHPGWADALLKPFEADPLLMETGPRPQCGFLAPDFHGRPGKGTPDYIEGWCFCVRREAVGRFGPYDEHHLKGFYGDDSDLSLRIKQAGYRISVAEDCKVDHLGSATLKSSPEERALMLGHEDRNLQVLRARWAN